MTTDLPFQTFFYWLGIVLAIKWFYDKIAPIWAPRYGQKPWVGKYGERCNNPRNKQPVSLLKMYDVVIIGAGGAGLANGYQLQKQSVENDNKRSWVILEQSNEIGTPWDERYDRLHLHTPKELSQLPGLDYPDIFPRFVSKQQFKQYLNAYAILFDLPILFNHKILSVEFDKAAKLWTLRVEILSADRNEDTKQNKTVTVQTRALINCCGREGLTEKRPRFQNEDKFKGRIIHSRHYKNGAAFTDGKVLLVGAGNSSIDIAMDLYEYKCQLPIYQLIRSPIQMIRRKYAVLNVWLDALLPAFVLNCVPRIVWEYAVYLENKRNFSDLEKYGITFNYWHPSAVANLWERLLPPVMDFGWADMIRKGDIKVVKFGIKEFYENGVILNDEENTRLAVDAVILATGFVNYDSCYKYLDKKLVQDCSDKEGMIASGCEIQQYPGLYFCGFKDFKGRFPEISAESKRIADHICSKY